jgi:antitoxin HicB
MYEYPVMLKKDTNATVLVGFADVPEAHTFGNTEDEALMRAVEALEVALSFYIDGKKDLPKPSAARRRKVVRPTALACAKLSLYQAMRDGNVRKSDLARKLGWSLMQVDRALDLMHDSRLDQIELALNALGKKITIDVSELRAA